MKPVLLLTATGQVGRHVVAGLADNGIPVRAVTRNARRARELFAAEGLATSGVEFIEAELPGEAVVRAAAQGCGQSYIASADSPDQVEVEVSAARAALDAGVHHIAKLSSCDAALDAHFSWARHHAETEQQITGMTGDYSFLRPHYFMQNLFSLADEVRATQSISVPTGEGRIGMIDARDIADVAVQLLTGEMPARRTVELTGPGPVNFAQVAAAISAATGQKIAFKPVGDETYQRTLIDRDGTLPEHAAEVTQVYRGVRNGVLDIHTDEVEKITGHSPRSIEQFARDYADRFM